MLRFLINIYLILIIIGKSIIVVHSYELQPKNTAKCMKLPNTMTKVLNVIRECEDELKNNLIKDTIEIFQETPKWQQPYEPNDNYPSDIYIEDDSALYNFKDSNSGWHRRYRRSNIISIPDHPALVPEEDKWLAGCLLHCIYRKNNAVNMMGWPTLDGIVEFFSEGVNEQAFTINTVRAADVCLKGSALKQQVPQNRSPTKGDLCDISYNIFDCITDKITEYCLTNNA